MWVIGDALCRAPGIEVVEYHSQTAKQREQALHFLRKQGGVCLTSYGIIVNQAKQLAIDAKGCDFVWVRNLVQSSDCNAVWLIHQSLYPRVINSYFRDPVFGMIGFTDCLELSLCKQPCPK